MYHQLTNKDIIEILINFSFEHKDYLGPEREGCGYDTEKGKVLFVLSGLEEEKKIKTTIHELYHAYSEINSLNYTEEEVTEYSDNFYKELYVDES